MYATTSVVPSLKLDLLKVSVAARVVVEVLYESSKETIGSGTTQGMTCIV